jgi:hypothetical protein
VKQVNKTANGKAYEMLSNLVGLCELARATGDRQWVVPNRRQSFQPPRVWGAHY